MRHLKQDDVFICYEGVIICEMSTFEGQKLKLYIIYRIEIIEDEPSRHHNIHIQGKTRKRRE